MEMNLFEVRELLIVLQKITRANFGKEGSTRITQNNGKINNINALSELDNSLKSSNGGCIRDERRNFSEELVSVMASDIFDIAGNTKAGQQTIYVILPEEMFPLEEEGCIEWQNKVKEIPMNKRTAVWLPDDVGRCSRCKHQAVIEVTG
ncbi:hypothetical protein HPP92_028773 [Vanilla planifolia]|uniref:Uncharacterized protein n=1 Tax=Vanilla planifolia TaxID=51239 RepID=A0A835P637_VANPL|nr:hypothetical protein HPP92_028773 [Vanilla planifolia]KAG0446583.1 hypothetical protein HPP92_028762 [Vanilla planifolia]